MIFKGIPAVAAGLYTGFKKVRDLYQTNITARDRFKMPMRGGGKRGRGWPTAGFKRRMGGRLPNIVRKRFRIGGSYRGKVSSGTQTYKNKVMPTTAFYQGKFGGVVRRRNAKRGSVYDKTGYRKEVEQFGTVIGTGTNCLRIGVKAYPCDDMLVGVFIVMLKYLLKKHYGYVYTNPDAHINPYNSAGGSNGRPALFQIRYARDTGVATRTYVTHGVPISQGDSIRDVAVALAIVFLDQYVGDNYYPVEYKFQDTYLAGATAIDGENTPYFPLTGMRIALYGKAEVVIQNTSTADNVDNYSIQFSDNNPLCGNILYLKGQVPNVKNIDVTLGGGGGELGMNYVNTTDGVIFSGVAAGQQWKSVQPLSAFMRGVKQVSGISLDPGNSKQYDVFFKYNGLLSTWFMRYFPGAANAVAGTGPSHRGGDSKDSGLNMIGLIQLEKRISTGLHPPRVNYHVDFHLGVRITSGPTMPSWNVDYGERQVNAIEL